MMLKDNTKHSSTGRARPLLDKKREQDLDASKGKATSEEEKRKVDDD